MSLRRSLLVGVCAAGAISVIVLVSASSQARPVLAPMLAATLIVVATGFLLWEKERKLPMFDVGMVCAVATLVYIAVPLLAYVLDGMRFTVDGDQRLFGYQPTSTQLGAYHWQHVAYLWFFCCSYLLVRRKAARLSTGVSEPSRATTHAVIVMFALLLAYFWGLQMVTGFSYLASYAEVSEAYATGKEIRLPRVVAQISHYLFGWYILFKLAVLILVVRRSHARAWFIGLCIWMAVEVLLAFLRLGDRTYTVMLVMAATILYHGAVRPIRLRAALMIATIFLWGFLAFGLERGGRTDSGLLTAGNEFQALLGTAWDVNEKTKADTLNPPWQIYLHDVMAALPAQQVVPFQKISASEWYADHMDPGIRGVQRTGWMWGVMSQVAIGYGWIELIIRACVLGLLLGWIHSRFSGGPRTLGPTLVYLWLCVRIYNTFRDGTFTLVTNVIWEVLPVVVILHLLPRLLTRAAPRAQFRRGGKDIRLSR